MADLKKSLAAKLYRSACPSSQVLGEYHLGLLEKERAAQIRAHLRECPLCSGEVEQLRTYLSDLEADLQPSLGERIQTWAARLLPNLSSGAAPAFAMRGDQGATMAYQAGDAQLNLESQVDPVQADRRTLLGLLLGASPVGVRARLLHSEQPLIEMELDELGSFFFSALLPGTYTLILRGEQFEIVVEPLEL